MDNHGGNDLQQIEKALLADDPGFIHEFQREAVQLPAPKRGASPPKPVVVATDGSLASLHAVQWAVRYAADESDAEFRIVHAFRRRAYPKEFYRAELRDLTGQQAASDITQSAVDLASALAPTACVTPVIVSGTVGPALVKHAADAQLLVLGARRTGLP